MNEYYTIYAWSDCPFCTEAKELLTLKEKQFLFCLVDESKELLQMYKDKHNWETVPMVFRHKRAGTDQWNTEFIGGYSDLVKFFSKEETDVT